MTYRDPSLHIRKSDFTKIFNRLQEDEELTLENLFYQCKAYSITSRGLKITDRKVQATISKLQTSTRLDADLFANLLHKHRISLRHRGIAKLEAGHRDWAILKQVSAQAMNFATEFNLELRRGIIEYIRIGCAKMTKFNVAKFVNLYENICETYMADIEIRKDEDSELTEKLYGIYSKKVLDQTGIFEDIKSDSTQYVYFVRARQQAKELNIALRDYIDAQFEGLDFTRGIPHPSQLSGPKATERLQRYLYKRRLQLNNDKNYTK